tara:strand:- start:697 stop:1152 length:456 start_codon:yes stop_codon:yes gene_type:complete
MELQKNIFTFILYLIITSVIGAIVVVAVNQATKHNTTVTELQNKMESLENSFDTINSDWKKISSDVVDQLQEINTNWKNVIKNYDKITFAYNGNWTGTGLSDVKHTWSAMAPMNCQEHTGQGGDWYSCNIGFNEGLSPDDEGAFLIHKKVE